jgi:hypothetical protein
MADTDMRRKEVLPIHAFHSVKSLSSVAFLLHSSISSLGTVIVKISFMREIESLVPHHILLIMPLLHVITSTLELLQHMLCLAHLALPHPILLRQNPILLLRLKPKTPLVFLRHQLLINLHLQHLVVHLAVACVTIGHLHLMMVHHLHLSEWELWAASQLLLF